MFRAKDISNGREVIILDAAGDEGSLEELRERGRSGQLRCPTCNHPVIVKAGEIKIWHFAHRHDANCPSHHEPVELLTARAALYHWLKAKFADGVTVEKHLPDAKLPRPFDCWVETGTTKIAYWVVLKQMKVGDRDAVSDGASGVNAMLNVVFVASMMRRHGPPKDVLYLSTTEREFLGRSKYNAVYATGTFQGSIHYLDPDTRILTTFRAMNCTEWPSQYTGHEVTTPLDAVLTLKATGEFVHPGEQRKWEEFEKQRQAEEARRREHARVAVHRPLPSFHRGIAFGSGDQSGNAEGYERTVRARMLREEAKSANLPPPLIPVVFARPGQARWEAICIHCGAVTRQWAVSSGDACHCLCVACQAAGCSAEGL